MKKILKTAAAALAGMLALGFAACTDGNGDYVPEKPTYFQKVSNEKGNNASVTAVWDFSDATAFTDKIDITTVSKIVPSSPTDGTGNAELVYLSGLAKDLVINEGKFLRVGSSTNANLTNLKDAKGSFKLTLNGQSNIQIYAYSDSNGGKPSTFVAVYKGDGSASAITERDKLPKYDSNDTDRKPTLGIEGAAAGTYIIYANAASIVKIDVNATSPFYSEEGVEGIALKYSDLHLEEDGSYSKELRLARKFALPDVYPANGDTVNTNTLLSAKWEIVGEKTVAKIVDDNGTATLVATHAGEVTARARVGRYAKDFTVKVVGSVDDFTLESPNTMTMEAFIDSLQFNVNENGEIISKYVTWEIVPVSPADKKIATVSAEGKIVGSEAGKIKVKASFKDGEGNEFAKESAEITITPCDKIIATLLDTESEEFPEPGTPILESDWADLVKDTTEIKNSETLTKENFEMSFLKMNDLWGIDSMSVLADSKDPSKRNEAYPGIDFVKDSTPISLDKASELFSFDVTINPEKNKTLKLTSVKLVLRTNQVKVDRIGVTNVTNETVLVSESVGSKDATEFMANLTNAESISEETVLKFTVTTEEYKKKDKEHFSISDIKLFFEKEN